ncbi:hypothetical protein [Sphingomonas sp. VNH70]|uniref:hypothetical protein n=1 Tax=Sphingomonas silueang TaxID=3156617 RepID=UPI0032B4413B
MTLAPRTLGPQQPDVTPPPPAPLPVARDGITLWRVAFVVLMLCFWEGFPFSVIGLPDVMGNQLYALLCLAGLGLYIVRLVATNRPPNFWDVIPVAFFLWCIVASARYSTQVAPQPLGAWLPAVFTVAPLLTILLYKTLGITRRDAEGGLFWAGLLGSLLVIADVTLGLHFLDHYARGSAFGEGRVVFLKLPATFGLMVALMRLIEFDLRRVPLHLLGVAAMGYNTIVLSESRLVIAALLLALIPVAILVLRGARRIVITVVGPLLLIPIVLFVIQRYLANFADLSSYLANDVSATFRRYESEFFNRYFMTTDGMGFGFMSGDPQYNNVLTYAAGSASEEFGKQYANYPIGLVDTGLISALYQFGWPGLFFVVAMTLIAAVALIASRRQGSEYATTAALGWLMIASMVSPISFNFFTLFYSAHIGTLLWFLASEASTRPPQPGAEG